MAALAMFMLTLFHRWLLCGPDKLESDIDHMKQKDSPSP